MTTTKELSWCLALTGAIALAAPPDAPPQGRPNQPRAAAGGTRAFSGEELPGPPLPEEVVIPQGSKADVLAWKQALDLQNELVIGRRAAEALLRTFQRDQHDARLARLLTTQASEAERLRLHGLRKRLGYSWKAVSDPEFVRPLESAAPLRWVARLRRSNRFRGERGGGCRSAARRITGRRTTPASGSPDVIWEPHEHARVGAKLVGRRHTKSGDLMAAPSSVDTRLGWRAQVQDLESAMAAALGATEAANLPEARLRLKACVQEVRGVVGPLKAAAAALASAFAAVDGVLAPAPGVAGPDAGVAAGGR